MKIFNIYGFLKGKSLKAGQADILVGKKVSTVSEFVKALQTKIDKLEDQLSLGNQTAQL